MNYLDAYWSRINHLGDSTAERIRNGGIRSFYKWLAESPHTMRQLSTERGIYFDGIILTNKDKEYSKIMFLNVANEIDIAIGDIMNWKLEDGTIEKWLVIQEEKKVNGTYRTFWIIRCNYLLKWIDGQGHLQQSWSYTVSSLDSKIKGNYRTWNSLITPQPNKFAEILMPRFPINRSTNFIIEDESWNVIEYDHTSVPGTIYLSLTEGKINLIYDDTENNIADMDRLAKYELLVPETAQIFNLNNEIEPQFTLVKNGIPINEPYDLISTNTALAKVIDGKLKAIGVGEVEIIVQLKNYPSIKKSLMINISEGNKEFSAYIEGADTIKLNRKGYYKLLGTDEINGTIAFSIIDDYHCVNHYEVDNNECTIYANDKNILKPFTLCAEYNGNTYTKVINIIPLW